MGHNLELPRDEVIKFTNLLAEHLKKVPEVKDAMKLAITQPKLFQQLVSRYAELIHYMAHLTQKEQEQILTAKHRLIEQNGEIGSAAEVSATELIQEIGDRAILPDLMRHILDASPTNEEALQILAQRMWGGHQMKLSGRTPRDGDKESNKVIWGHTQITDPLALLHFTFCHYLERYYAIRLSLREIPSATQKDFFLNAMIDALIVDHLGENQFQDIYDIWSQSKPLGLGWIIPQRLNSYMV